MRLGIQIEVGFSERVFYTITFSLNWKTEMFRGYIKLLGEEVNYFTNQVESLWFMKSLPNYLAVPCYEFVADIGDKNVWSLVYIDDKTTIDYSEKCLTYRDSWKYVKHSSIMRTLLLALTDIQRQSQDRFLLHAACVEKNGKAIVLWGGSGTGKTACILNLCLEYGFRLIANDFVQLYTANKQLFARRVGLEQITLRQHTLMKGYPQLLARFFPSLTSRANPWQNKKSVSAEEVGLQVCEAATPVEQICRLLLDDSLDKCFFQPFDDIERLKAELFEQLSRRIYGSAYPLLKQNGDFSLPMPNLDNPQAWANRVEFIKHVTGSNLVYALVARLETCLNLINNLIV